VTTVPWMPDHSEAGFLPTPAQYTTLLDVGVDHPLYQEGYDEAGAGRDPNLVWNSQASHTLAELYLAWLSGWRLMQLSTVFNRC
jgi:hypothetical protein